LNAADANPAAAPAVIRRLWRDWMRPYRRLLAANLGLIAFVAGATAAYPLIIQWALDGFGEKSTEVISLAPLVVIAAVLIKSGALYAHRLLTNGVLARIDADMQRAMHDRLMHADLAALDREAPAATASRFTTDITYVHGAIEKFITSLVRDGLTVVGLLASLLWIDWELTLYALAALPLAGVPIAGIGKRLRRIARSSQEQAAEMTARINEGLSGIRLSKTYRLEDYLSARADETFETQRLLKVRATDQRARIDPLLEALAGIGLAAVFWVIGSRIASGDSTIGEFMAFVSAFLIAGQPLRAFGQLYATALQGVSAAERIYDLLDTRPTIADRPAAPAIGKVVGEVRLDNVGFNYAGGAQALSGVSLTVPAGSRVALVGRSGAGKSTVFNLIPRLYDATAGRVLIDGQDVRDVTVASLRDAIAVVSQDAVIFDDTVARNIGFGRQGADRPAIEQAARAAQAHAFVARLPGGFDAMAGERGGRFSGGERQRLSIARAILRDAPILLLDEATSALDAESEDAIRQALEELSKGRTTIVIAHRLSTVRDADLIVAMDRGRIVEQGSHRDLIAAGGLYADLHKLQFRGG
jgi:subfamily B ATP-binding cassette protein MsbA